jgi:ribosomal protein S18 acetylase RimI-like enzyme
MTRLHSLESLPRDEIHRAFLRAFADYSVPIEASAEQLAEMHRRRGVDHELSFGAFEGGELVGFTFNGLGTWDGCLAGYDAGTGVVPHARGRGLAARLMGRSLERLQQAGATTYVLEVIQSNTSAFKVYERLGFRITRELLCWSVDEVPQPATPAIAVETGLSIPDPPMRDWSPSWQNSDESIARASEPRTILTARRDGEDVGYAVLFESGDLAQLAVAPGERRRGIGTALCHAARGRSARPLRIINTDARDSGTTRFLESLGGSELVRQFEMTIAL